MRSATYKVAGRLDVYVRMRLSAMQLMRLRGVRSGSVLRMNMPKTGKESVRIAKSLFPDDPNPVCGYGPLSTNPEKEPFLTACVIHDHEFGLKEKDEQPKSLWRVDWEFYQNMRLIAGSNVLLNLRAVGYFIVAKLLGPFFW